MTACLSGRYGPVFPPSADGIRLSSDMYSMNIQNPPANTGTEDTDMETMDTEVTGTGDTVTDTDTDPMANVKGAGRQSNV